MAEKQLKPGWRRVKFGDILRYGPDVLVMGPLELKRKVQKLLLAEVGWYV